MASTEEPTGTTEAANTTDITDTGMPSVAPSEGATDPTPVPAKRAPRKRAASRAPKRATNGEEGPTEAGEVQLADGDQAQQPLQIETTPAAPRVSRTRRARKVAAESPEPIAAASAAPEAPSGAPEALTVTEDAPAAPAAASDSVGEATPAARKRTPRKRATKAAAAPAVDSADLPADHAQVGADEQAPAVPIDPDAVLESDALDILDSDTEGDHPAYHEPVATVPSFGVLFQAPAPVVAPRRSRRASSPAVAPKVDDPAVAASDETDDPDEPATDAAALTRGAIGAGATDAGDVGESGSSEADGDADGEDTTASGRRRRRRGGKGRRPRGADVTTDSADGTPVRESAETGATEDDSAEGTDEAEDDNGAAGEGTGTRRRTRRRRRTGSADTEDAPGVVTRVRQPRPERDEVTGVKGSTRLEAKRQRRREGREAGRRRTIITEAEFLARRESVERVMVVRARQGRTQIGVLEDGVLVEHYVSRETNSSMAGNIYLGRVQNVLPSMEAAFVDIGRGRNAVLYAGEVNWDAAGLDVGSAKRIENALESGQSVLVQVTKDPIGHKGARLTSQISLPGRYLVYVPDSSMTGISRKLPDTERARLKRILRDVVPESAGVIVRTAAEGASEEELRADVERLTAIWEQIKAKADGLSSGRKGKGGVAPTLLHGEPDMTVRVIRDVFNEDFTQLVVSGDTAWAEVNDYVNSVAPDLAPRLHRWTSETDIFAQYRVDEQIAKAMDRKVWLPSGGSLVIDRTEAMTVVDVNTGKFVGSGGNLEETVTRNNIEAAEEIVRQLRLRDIGGIIVIDFIDMVLESNRDLVVRRLLECLGRDRTKHQVAEVTSLGLVQMTRKRVGSGLIEVFSESCAHCNGRGYIVHTDPIERGPAAPEPEPAAGPAPARTSRSRRGRSGVPAEQVAKVAKVVSPPPGGPTPAQIAAAAHAAAVKSAEAPGLADDVAALPIGGAEAPVGRAATELTEVVPEDLGSDAVHGVELVGADRPAGAEASAVGADSQAADEPEAEPQAEPDAQPKLDTDTDADAGAEAEAAAVEVDDESVATAPRSSTTSRGRGRRRRGRASAPAGPPRPAS